MTTVRIHSHLCTEPRARHEQCDGVLYSDGVRFVCICRCHAPLFDTPTDVTEERILPPCA